MFKIFNISIILMFLFFCMPLNAEVKKLEGGVEKDEIKLFKSGLSEDVHGNADVQVLGVNFYYYPDADVSFQLLKREGQKEYPHLLDYREIDGLYRKALSDSNFQEELKVWKSQGGPSPYYFNVGVKIRNNGDTALTDVKLTFNIEAKVATLRANTSSVTTDYKDLYRNSRWTKWLTKSVTVKMLPPGEYMVVHTDDLPLCSLLQNIKNQWPETIRVKVHAYSSIDSLKNNNDGFTSFQLIPDHFVFKVLR